jgi:hypothetical protein
MQAITGTSQYEGLNTSKRHLYLQNKKNINKKDEQKQ